MTISREFLRTKLDEALAPPPRVLTPRDIRLPAIPGKAFAVIGVRRSGKTSFLAQCRSARLHAGARPESQLLLLLEDERLAGLTVADLGWLLEEHARRFPELLGSGGVTLYLDEVQNVPGWERLVRRLIDTRGMEVFVTGSSAKLLSREVATSLRGRAMEVLVHPFSFREALRHTGDDPPPPETIDRRLRRYLVEGGFPEAQGVEPQDRAALLTGYVDVVVLRDVIERHGVTNPLALRWLQRQLLANPGGRFSVQKQYDTLRSQGVRVGKDTLHAYLGYLEDAFLVRTVSLHSALRAAAHGSRAQGVSRGSGADRPVRDQRPQPRRPRPRNRGPAGAGAARLGRCRTYARRKGGRSTSSRTARGSGLSWCRCVWRRSRTRRGSGRCEPSARPVRRTRMPGSCSLPSTRHRLAARCRSPSPGCRPRAGSWIVDPVPAPALLWREVNCRCRSI